MNPNDAKLLNDIADFFGDDLPSGQEILDLGITTTSLQEALAVTKPALNEAIEIDEDDDADTHHPV